MLARAGLSLEERRKRLEWVFRWASMGEKSCVVTEVLCNLEGVNDTISVSRSLARLCAVGFPSEKTEEVLESILCEEE